MTHLDEVYRERAQLVAFIAHLFPSYMTLSLDLDQPDWWTVFIYAGTKQLSWHIAPGDVELFSHVRKVHPNAPFVQWDGHTTPEKYQRMQDYIRVA
ncbi:hypothetical protein ACFYP4_02930 [Streptomyces sp. NPDC005551]|uniref:hypothetical protein n=1 Tax=Streptomyces sp. NPDC005551 TaxID=3364725 RepID=UPI00369A61FB